MFSTFSFKSFFSVLLVKYSFCDHRQKQATEYTQIYTSFTYILLLVLQENFERFVTKVELSTQKKSFHLLTQFFLQALIYSIHGIFVVLDYNKSRSSLELYRKLLLHDIM